MSWLDSRLALLRSSPNALLILAGPRWGVQELLAELSTAQSPVIWVDFSTDRNFDSVEQGIALSDAVRTAFGASLFGYGVPIQHGLAILERHSDLLGPFTIAISAGDNVPSLVDQLWAMASSSIKIIVVADEETPQSRVDELLASAESVISGTQLRVTENEALELSGHELELEELRALLVETDGAYMPFLATLYRRLGLPPPRTVTPATPAFQDGEQPSDEQLLYVLVNRGRWIEALELAVRRVPERVAEVVAEAGDRYFDRGLFDALWRLLSSLPDRYRRTEPVLYWLLSAAIVEKRQQEVIEEVEDFLRGEDAAELRALYAASGLARAPLAEAARAYAAKKSGITAQYFGFVLATHSDPAKAIDLLVEALDRFQKREKHHRVVSTAANICDAYINLGEYRKAEVWAGWALREFALRDLKEELLRYRVVSLLSYVKLLLGEVEAGASLLETVELTNEILGVPSMESLVSTLGDYALVTGDAAEALRYYEILQDRFRSLNPYAVNDMVKALLHLGEVEYALKVSTEAAALASTSNEYMRHRALLALGTVEAELAPARAVSTLEKTMAHYEAVQSGPELAQAGIHLARAFGKLDRWSDSRAALARAEPGLRELSRAGWLLLSGKQEVVDDLLQLWNEDAPPLEIRFLGSRKARLKHRTREFPLRWCEILAVLAYHRTGISGERLALQLYSDGGNMTTIKSNLSRLRKEIPIDSRPYRIDLPFKADFVEMDEALSDGRVREALELYQGPLLPESEAPFVVEMREHLEESLRQAALASGDAEVLLSLARKLEDDLELWEAVSQRLSPNDPQLALARAHVKRIQRSWEG